MEFIIATNILKEYNSKVKTQKRMKEFFENNGTKNMINLICSKYNIPRAYMTKRGNSGFTSMHPELCEYFKRWLYKLPNQTFSRDELEFSAAIEESFKGILKFERQKLFDSYYVDIYCDKLKLCIEFDEDHHNLKKNKDEDVIREKHITEKFNVSFIRHNKKTDTVFNTINKIALFKNLYVK